MSTIKKMIDFTSKNSPTKWIAFSIFCLFFACQNQQASTDNATTSTPSSKEEEKTDKSDFPTAQKADIQAKDLVYSWVDKLNIRDAPNTKGKAIATVQSEDALEFTGEKSDKNETIVLRGVAYDEPWLKVITPDKKEGWVFGGAVKRKDENKGNGIIDENHLDFPYFGSFNLKDWKKQSSKDESGGDAEIMTITYKKGKQFLEISKIEVGDYGYGRTYKLLDANKRLLKERELNFIADAELRALRETVKDFTTNPPRQYTRTQKMKKHHSQLNALPMMVNGTWTESSIKGTNADAAQK